MEAHRCPAGPSRPRRVHKASSAKSATARMGPKLRSQCFQLLHSPQCYLANGGAPLHERRASTAAPSKSDATNAVCGALAPPATAFVLVELTSGWTLMRPRARNSCINIAHIHAALSNDRTCSIII